MGKHERLEIENAEKIVVDLLNNQKVIEEQKKNKWFPHALKLKKVIIKNFGNIESSEHIGNTYSGGEIGDIKILTENNKNWIYIELKMSESKKGKGTLANISQDALTNSNLFKSRDIYSWSKFRRVNDFDKLILDELNQYTKYPNNLNKGSINQQKIKKGVFLKKEFLHFTKKKRNIANFVCDYVKTPGISDVASIICSIINYAKEDKINYLNYLRKFEQNPEFIKKFIIAMLIGYHTQNQIKYILELPYDDILKILDTYYVYYTNERNGNVIVSTDNLGKEIQNIIKSDVKITFLKDKTNCIIQSGTKNVLRVVFHWKNKFQGIETPCLNIFKEI